MKKNNQDREGALFFMLIHQLLSSLTMQATQCKEKKNLQIQLIDKILDPDERVLFLRERSNTMYGITAYFLSKIFAGIFS